MRARILILAAVASNLAVMACTFAVWGWSVAGAHAAARNTARLSGLWFALAFVAPGLVRFFRTAPAPATLVLSFFGAHAVHFGTVAILLATFDFPHVLQNPAHAAAVVLGGFTVVLVVALTATPGPSWTYLYLHRVTLYAVFVLFFVAFASRHAKLERTLAALLLLSLFLRLAGSLKPSPARVLMPN